MKFTNDGNFQPNNILSYMYPLDRFSTCKSASVSEELEASNFSIAKGVEEISRRLLIPLLEFPSVKVLGDDEDDLLKFIASLISGVQSMSIESTSSHNNKSVSLTKLYHFHVKINALLWTRKANQKHKQNIHFSLGQVVKHRLYGFRGIVGAWDSKPRWDVSGWDGLRNVNNPNEKPFYHIYPDINDCIDAFGEPRNFRYVCQENLEPIHENDAGPIELDTDSSHFDEWSWDAERKRYCPSVEMKVSIPLCCMFVLLNSIIYKLILCCCTQFMYAENLGKHEDELLTVLRKLRVRFM